MPGNVSTVGRFLLRHPDWVVAALLFSVSVVFWLNGRPVGVDSAVYWAGALAALHGNPLYGSLPALPTWVGGLPFIYPPAAALLFAPLAVVPVQLAWGLMAALSVLGAGHVLRAIRTGPSTPTPHRPLPVVVLLGALCLEPLWLTIGLGQVNVLLMTLIVLDVLVLPASRWRGTMVGLAAAVKLTPLVFVVHLALTGRRGDAGRALAVFGLLNILGALLLPGDTVQYWRSQVLGGVHVTSQSWGGNQSLNGLLQRLTGEASWAFAAAIVAGLGCLALALPLARRLHERGEPLVAMLVTGVCGVLVSPISWTHHWVWVIPLFGLLVQRVIRPRRRVVALIVLFSVFTGWMYQVVPMGGHRELAWTPLQVVLGNTYVFAALAAVPAMYWWVFRRPAKICPSGRRDGTEGRFTEPEIKRAAQPTAISRGRISRTPRRDEH